MKGPASGPPEQTSASVLCPWRGGRLSAGQGVAGGSSGLHPRCQGPSPNCNNQKRGARGRRVSSGAVAADRHTHWPPRLCADSWSRGTGSSTST